jgi:hypothetical protein
MARSQFNFTVAEPDGGGVLSVVSGATVEIVFRNADGTDGAVATVYLLESGGSAGSNPLSSNAQGLVSGYLEDGRFRAKVTDVTSPFDVDFEARSGGTVKVAKEGNPAALGANSQVVLEDDDAGANPAILLGPGDDVPDIEIRRTDDNELTLDTVIPGNLSVRINGDVRVSGPGDVLSVNGARVQDGGTPLANTDLATKAYVDATNSQVDDGFYSGHFHNLPLTTNMVDSISVTADTPYLTKVNVPVGTTISQISFVRGTGTSSPLVQFGLFAEFSNYDGSRVLACVAATEHNGGSWATEEQKGLRLGMYDGVDFIPIPYYFGTSLSFVPLADPDPAAVFTGNLFAGILTDTTINLTGANITSPIVDSDLGIDDEADQFPFFAGATATTLELTTSVYLIGEEGSETELAFPATRASAIPFVRLKV